jgi:hypothetical protein
VDFLNSTMRLRTDIHQARWRVTADTPIRTWDVSREPQRGVVDPAVRGQRWFARWSAVFAPLFGSNRRAPGGGGSSSSPRAPSDRNVKAKPARSC